MTPYGLVNFAALAGADVSTFGQQKILFETKPFGRAEIAPTPEVTLKKAKAVRDSAPLSFFGWGHSAYRLHPSDVIVMSNGSKAMTGHSTRNFFCGFVRQLRYDDPDLGAD
ncbi:hypothetical protein [Ruegeria sp. SCP11]|uniref:hypothetical protein n=1 Tax=Ruegeria sp. SCP11 TaxID=3141378 RepID=UPI003337B9DC